MKLTKRILTFLVLVLTLFLTACSGFKTTYDVRFNVNGGTSSETTYSAYKSESGKSINVPIEPNRTNYVFRYWYTVDKNRPYDFETPLTSNITLNAYWSKPDVSLNETEVYSFKNLTTEFEVADGSLELHYTENGSVPYVSIMDYLELIDGFIDPEVEFTVNENSEILSISYQYYDEDEDETYDLEVIFDLKTNLVHTNDPSFYWAYIYSTETNYGRNIEYLYDHENTEYIEGETVIYNLNDFKMDLVFYDGQVAAPYYLVNQLFAGSSYYNVYFNGDKLFGVYGQLSTSDPKYRTIRQSSKNNTPTPRDLVDHSYDLLAFNLFYFYGLYDYKEISNPYTYLSPEFSNLNSTDPQESAEGLFNLINKYIDEPHTSYNFSGYHAPLNFNVELTSMSQLGPNVTDWYYDGLYAVDDALMARWNITNSSSWAAYSSKRPKYWAINDESVVISFDSFDTADIDESATWEDEPYQYIFEVDNLLPSHDADKYFVYNNSDKTNKVSETLLWGVGSSFRDDYTTKLLNNGFVLNSENNSFVKTINDVQYVVTLDYNSTHNMGYIGVSNKALTPDITGLIQSDSAVDIELTIAQVKKAFPNVKNLGLDISFNMGGNIGALYRIVGLITDQPFAVSSYDRSTGSYSTTYVTTTYDSYSEYDWFLITSKVTFSAANQLATIFRQNNLGLILGQTSGGGTSSITPILLPDGSFFTMSSNNMNMLRLEDGTYVINENGITPDYLIDTDKLYDISILEDVLNR